jgi:hypothetical protein
MEKDIGKDPTMAFWLKHIEAYEKKAARWHDRSNKIIDKYTDAKENRKTSEYNILWSNVQTLLPALFDRPPTPNVERRFNKSDVVGKEASTLLERSTSYFVATDDFGDKIRQAVLDRLLVGRGNVWVRYSPTIEAVPPEFNAAATDTTAAETQISEDVEERVKYEDVVFDFVAWDDFGHTVARTWQEVRAVWRRVFMDRADLEARFPEIGSKIPLNAKADGADSDAEKDRAEIYEIWDKKKKRVLWLCKEHDTILDEKDDPLKLKDFFPCPKPLYATVSNKSLIPTPDYVIYQDQAREMDTLTGRINLLLEAVRVAGVYDASAAGVAELVSGGSSNKLIPIDQYAILGEKGGLKGIIEYLPIEQIVNVIQRLYEARERLKSDLYEITGMSDIIRGASNPNETATAQQIKGQYASMRLGDMQKDVARFCRDLVRITAEIVAGLFSIETIAQIASSDLPTQQSKMMAQMQAQAQNQQPDADMMQKPTIEDVDALLKDDAARCFRISIETDSTIKVDQEAEKAARTEFLTAAGGFIQQAAQVPVPELQPLLMDMLLFGVRGFKAARELESSFEEAQQRLEDKAKQPPQPPQPDPALELDKARLQSEEKLKGAELQLKAQELGMRQQEQSAALQLKQIDLQIKQIELRMKEMELIAQQTQPEQRTVNELS